VHWKPPGAKSVEFGYHQDIGFRRPREAYRSPETSYIQTGIAIDAHRADNGAMTVLPGSHKLGGLAFAASGRVMNRSISDGDLEALGIDPASKVDLVLEPGDVALWHLCLIHGSGPNLSRGDRRFYLNGYVIAENCDRGEWAFRDGSPCALGEPVLVHYDDLHARPEPHYLD
jgi:ectoine hydroxylase-related dioxygenase (phytanoyl-CoA dioxygenase family)